MKRTRFVLVMVVVGAMILPVSGMAKADVTPVPWTVMIYCGADSQYYTDEAIKFNVKQCQEGLVAEGAGDKARVFVFMDLDGDKNSYYFELTGDMVLPAIDRTVSWASVDGIGYLSGGQELDASKVATLNQFLDTVESSCNGFADSKKLLVLKNGHAWCGICPDADADEEALMMPLTDVADAVTGRGIDILAFDGDNMASVEAAYELRGKVGYMVATQQDMPIDGLPYKTIVNRLSKGPADVEAFAIQMTEDFVNYYDNRYGNKQANDHLLSKSQMAVTASAVYLGDPGPVQDVVGKFNEILRYMIDNTYDAEGELLPDAWMPKYRDCLASARDYALIGKMGDQMGYEWLPDIYTWLYGVANLVEAYNPNDPIIDMVRNKDTGFLQLLEPGGGFVVSNKESSIILISGNSDAHGLNFWFPPTALHWENWLPDDARARSYLYDGYSASGAAFALPAEYYCIDCPVSYETIGLDFVDDSDWMEFLGVYYDARWLLASGPAEGERNKPSL